MTTTINHNEIAVGEKITFTGTLIFNGRSEVYRYGAKPSKFRVIKDEETGISYNFKSAADFSKHIKNFPSFGGLAVGNTVTFTATVKSVGTYKGEPSIKVMRPRLVAVERSERAKQEEINYMASLALGAPLI